MDILLTGRAIGSERALAIGLASRKVANGTTRVAAEKLALEIAGFTPMAIAVDRQTAYAAQEGDVNVAVSGEVRASHEVFATEGLPGVTELMGVERPASKVLSLAVVAAA
jgi:enoyl-CoA hydratase